jgi:hypothetical protein
MLLRCPQGARKRVICGKSPVDLCVCPDWGAQVGDLTSVSLSARLAAAQASGCSRSSANTRFATVIADMARGVDSRAAGGRAYRRSGVAFLASCSLISLTAGVPAWVAATLMLTAVVTPATGELWHPAASFEISFALAPDHATRQYLGVFGHGLGLAETPGPRVHSPCASPGANQAGTSSALCSP